MRNHGMLIGIILGIIGIGAMVSADVYIRVVSQREQWKVAAEQSADGDAYPYLFADKGDLTAGKDELRLWLGSAGGTTSYVSIWISPAEANRDPNDARYWSLSRLKSGKPLVYEGAVMLGMDIPPGDYFVELSARNGTVVERLTIDRIEYPCGGEGCLTPERTIQKINLQRSGKELEVPSIAMNRRD